ncbi:hypothetical protein BS47DRAFT_1362885 [Hydnum rufescens UP504]|uniref:Uncharacterized protein n=1 Tax=Hydnum rufescens UP504 TaxID=1448309 RepID=A0A9P6AVU3_9AGAM|nr:hypothetical protein BS47DRAFT_1362885 [Hydnum rufescens UP504]
MSTIQHKYIVTLGILGVDPGFKALNWCGDIDTMFSIGIIHLLAWFAATQVHITDIYTRADNPYIVALITDEDIKHAMDTLAFKNYQEIWFGLVGLIIDRSAKPRLTILSQTNHCKAFGEGGSDFMDTSPTSPTCIAQLSHAAIPLPADDGMDGMDINELPMPGTRDTDKAHEDTVDKLPASPAHAPDPPPVDDGIHIDELPVSGSGDVGKAHDTVVIPNYFHPPCPHIIEDWVFFEC